MGAELTGAFSDLGVPPQMESSISDPVSWLQQGWEFSCLPGTFRFIPHKSHGRVAMTHQIQAGRPCALQQG